MSSASISACYRLLVAAAPVRSLPCANFSASNTLSMAGWFSLVRPSLLRPSAAVPVVVAH